MGLSHRKIAALSHPIRIAVLRDVAQGECSPSMVAERTGYSVESVAYHFRGLASDGIIKRNGTRPGKNGTERLFVLNEERAALASAILRKLVVDLNTIIDTLDAEALPPSTP